MELFERAHRGDLEGVKTLIQQRVHVNTKNRNHQTALYCACEHGHTEVAQYLLDNGASVNHGAKPLIAAVRNNHYDCAKLLLQHHADINCTNTKGESPMSVALQKDHYSIILLLLEYGAVPTTSLSDIAVQLLKRAKLEHAKAIQKLIDKNLINLTLEGTFLAAFGFAFKHGSIELAEKMLSTDSYSKMDQLYPDAAYYSAKNNWPTILSSLLEKRVDINLLTDSQTPLYVACKEGHEAIVTLLLNHGADPNMPNKLTTSESLTLPLQIAVQHGNAVIFNRLLEKGAKMNKTSEPLLHTACSGSDERKTKTRSVETVLSIIRMLLQQGVNVNAVSAKGDTALYRACTSQQLEIVQILLEAGADVNLTSSGRYPLFAACDAGNVELINLLLKAGADVKCRNRLSKNETCLHAITKAYSSTTYPEKPSKLDIVSIINSLLEAGVDVNAICSQKETALYRASKAGHVDIVRLLLEAGAEINGSSSRRPLYAACEHGYTEIVDLLLQHGADSNSTSSDNSSYSHDHPLFFYFGLGTTARETSSPPICCAVQKDYTDIINLLLKHGADVNEQDQFGKSALIYVLEMMTSESSKTNQLQERDFNILKSMLSAGGDVNMLSRSRGLAPLHMASSSGKCDLMMELIQHGANCNGLTSRGKSALDLACDKGHEAAMELLLKNGAKPSGKVGTTCCSSGVYSSYHSEQTTMPVLCTASKNGNGTMVQMLLKHGADANSSDEKGNTALHLASTSSFITEMLLNAGANVNATNDNGETTLSIVCKKQQADANVVELLLKFGADPNIHFALHAACKNNNLDSVRLLLANGADANLVKESVYERMIIDLDSDLWMVPTFLRDIEPSPLCIACRNGNLAIVECLLKNGAGVAFADHDGNTPLHGAIEALGLQANSEEYNPIVTLLLQHDAPVDVVSNEGETPLYAACIKGHSGTVKQLLDCRANVGLTTNNSNKYPLLIACERKFRDIAMMLLDRGADANVSNKYQQTPLKLASANRDDELVKQLLVCGADVNQMQNVSDTALHVAVVHCKGADDEAFHNIVKRLLKSNAEINACNHNRGETPLYVACRPTDGKKVNVDIVQTLLKHGADPNICPSSDVRVRNCILPPLSAAVVCGDSELVMLLIKFGARLDRSDDLGRTALHFAVGDEDLWYTRRSEPSKANSAAIAEMLVSAGADVNAMDKMMGTSPLYSACKAGKTELVKLLLSRGANPNTKAQGETLRQNKNNYPIHAACRGQHYDSVKLLLEYSADVAIRDETGKTALHHAVESESHYSSNKRGDQERRTDLVQLLLDGGANVNAPNNSGETPFYIACSNGLASVAQKMLVCGAQMDGSSGSRKLLLNAVCRNKHLPVAELLLSNGANPDIMEVGIEDRHGRTLPLHIAAADDNSELVELLLKHGANVDVADVHGSTALYYAVENYRTTPLQYSHKVRTSKDAKSVVDILLENKADVNVVNSAGKTPLYMAVSRSLLDIVSKMLQTYGGNRKKSSLDKHCLVAACDIRNLELVDMLLKHGADPNPVSSCEGNLPLCSAVRQGNCDEIIISLIKAGAFVNATNREGQSPLCVAIENMTNYSPYHYQYTEPSRNKLSTIRLLLEHGADLNMLMPSGRSLLRFVVTRPTTVEEVRGRDCRTTLGELLQLMIKHGAILSDLFNQLAEDGSRQLPRDGTLKALATFDGRHEFIVHLFRAGAGFQLLELCCNTIARSPREVKSICLCKAVVLAGYTPSAEELQQLQLAASDESTAGGLTEQLVNWLNEDKQQVPTLFRQCRIAIRRQLSAAARFQSMLPAIDKLPLPNDLKLYLQFDGSMSEVDLKKDLQPPDMTEVEDRCQLISPYNSDYSDYGDVSDFEDYCGYDVCDYYDSDNEDIWF